MKTKQFDLPMDEPTVLDALTLGLPVKLPADANAVRVVTEWGNVATVLATDLAVLKGAGPFKSATAGRVKFNGKGGFSSESFEPVHKRIGMRAEG